MKTNKKAKKVVKKAAKLTKIEEKRVAILKDAVAQIKLEALVPRSGNGYVENYELDDDIKMICNIADIVAPKGKKTELQFYMDKLINKSKPCEVCAKGALLISSIRKYNNVSLADLEEEDLGGMAHRKTVEIFGPENANLMEEYFEHGEGDVDEDEENPWLNESDTQRVLRIFNNAIRNKGIFKPEQEKF